MAFFVFLYLLKRDAEKFGQRRLAKAIERPPDADIFSDNDVDCFFLHNAP